MHELLSRGRELLSFFGEQYRQELCRPGRTCIARYGVKLSRSFQKHLPDCVSLLRLVANLRTDLTFENIRNCDSRMPVRSRTLAWRIGDLHCSGGPIPQSQVR